MISKNNLEEINSLSECERGCKVKVVKLNASSELKQRFISFGIMKGSTIEVLEHTNAKSTLEIKVGKMSIALRAAEAKFIQVERI